MHKGFNSGDYLTPSLVNQLNAEWFITTFPEWYGDRAKHMAEAIPQVEAEPVILLFESIPTADQLAWAKSLSRFKGRYLVGNEPGSVYNLTPEVVALKTQQQVEVLLNDNPNAYLIFSMGHQNGCPRNSHKEKFWINQLRKLLGDDYFKYFKGLHWHYYPEQEIPSQLPDSLKVQVERQPTFGLTYNQVLLDRWPNWVDNHELDYLDLWVTETGCSKQYEDKEAVEYLKLLPWLLKDRVKYWAWYAAEAHPDPATRDNPGQYPAYHYSLLIRDGKLTQLGQAFASM